MLELGLDLSLVKSMSLQTLDTSAKVAGTLGRDEHGISSQPFALRSEFLPPASLKTFTGSGKPVASPGSFAQTA